MLCNLCSPSIWASKSICSAATCRLNVAASDAGGTINPSALNLGPNLAAEWGLPAGVGMALFVVTGRSLLVLRATLEFEGPPPPGCDISIGMMVEVGLLKATVLLDGGTGPGLLVVPLLPTEKEYRACGSWRVFRSSSIL